MIEKFIGNGKIKDFAYVLVANIFTILNSIVTTIVIPTVLSVEDFGYYRVFTFYAGFLGFLQLGFIDGIYIKYKSFNYDDLPKKNFKIYFYFLLFFQTVMAVMLFAFALFFKLDMNRIYIAIAISLNLILLNLGTFLGLTYQVTKRFNVYSISLTISKILFIIFSILYFVFRHGGYLYFIAITTVTNAFLVVYYVVEARDIISFSLKGTCINKIIVEIIDLIKVGFLNMIANTINLLVLNMGQLFVERLYSPREFGVYSLAVSMSSMIIILQGAVATTLYPYLARVTEEKLPEYYSKLQDILAALFTLFLAVFFIGEFIIGRYLTKYTDSIMFSLFIFPMTIYYGQVSSISLNYYRILNLQKRYIFNHLISCIFSVALIFGAYYLTGNILVISIASLVSMYILQFVTDVFFGKYLKIKFLKVHFVQISSTVAFIAIGYKSSWYIGLITYVLFEIALLGILYRNYIIVAYRKFRSVS